MLTSWEGRECMCQSVYVYTAWRGWQMWVLDFNCIVWVTVCIFVCLLMCFLYIPVTLLECGKDTVGRIVNHIIIVLHNVFNCLIITSNQSSTLLKWHKGKHLRDMKHAVAPPRFFSHQLSWTSEKMPYVLSPKHSQLSQHFLLLL